MRSLRLPLLMCVLFAVVASCGGGPGDPEPMDLGGGLSMAADGAILGAADRPVDQHASAEIQ